MQTLHLFAGAGGGLLADLILGHTPIGAVEFDPYCCRVLRERAADGWFPELRVHEGDVRLFDPSEYAGRVDCIHAGFPCQPHSVAGKREGEADERNLWPDTKRIISQLRPRFAFLENVPGIVSNGYAAVVIGELSEMGYDCRWAIISASDVGAKHIRARFWCLCTDANSLGHEERINVLRSGRQEAEGEQPWCEADGISASEITADTERWKQSLGWTVGRVGRQRESIQRNGYWETKAEPCLDGTHNGIPNRIHRLKALGNGQVPLQAALAWRILGGPIK